jgi:hypothetical protein
VTVSSSRVIRLVFGDAALSGTSPSAPMLSRNHEDRAVPFALNLNSRLPGKRIECWPRLVELASLWCAELCRLRLIYANPQLRSKLANARLQHCVRVITRDLVDLQPPTCKSSPAHFLITRRGRGEFGSSDESETTWIHAGFVVP